LHLDILQLLQIDEDGETDEVGGVLVADLLDALASMQAAEDDAGAGAGAGAGMAAFNDDRASLWAEVKPVLRYLYEQNMLYFGTSDMEWGGEDIGSGFFERDPQDIFKGAEVVDLRN
jgi:hypothetical protein